MTSLLFGRKPLRRDARVCANDVVVDARVTLV